MEEVARGDSRDPEARWFFLHLRTRGVILGFHLASRGARPMRIKGFFAYQKGSNGENIWGSESRSKTTLTEKKN